MSIEPGKTWGFPGIYYNYLIQPMKRVDLYGFQLQLQVEVNVSACNVAITGCEKSRLWQKALHLFIQIDQMKLEPKPGEELTMLITDVLRTSMNWAPSSEAFFSKSEDAFI
jgi:hypothetical protein